MFSKSRLDPMSETLKAFQVRCVITGHRFDFKEDLGAVYIGAGSAACSACMDRMFPTPDDLSTGPTNDMVKRKPKKIGYFGKLRP